MDNTTPAFHPLDYVSVVQRRLWWLVLPIALAAVVGAALVTWLPRTYEATTTLGVALPAISPELVASSTRITPEERRRSIQQVLLSQAVIERVVKEEGLAKNVPITEAAAKVRSSIEVSYPTPDPNAAATIEQFTITYSDSTPERAQQMANRLADVFVQESSARRADRAMDTSMFINAQLESSQERLNALEARLRTAKEAFMGSLPEQTEANVAMVQGAQQQLQSIVNLMRGEQDRLALIERSLETVRAGATTPSVPGMPAIPASAAARVVAIEAQIAEKRGVFTESHPEIQGLREELAAAKAEAAAEAKRPLEDRVASLQLDPNYVSLMKEAQTARLRIQDLQRQEKAINSQIGVYRARVESAPRVEQQIATLQREYNLEKDQYSQLMTRLRNSEMQENVVRNRGAEEFAVLARATYPLEPAAPNPQRLMLAALMLGICLGGGLALGREYLDRSIHDARALTDTDLQVLGEIPRIANA